MTDRYQRHGLIDWFDQKRLREVRVVVVGAGAVGNEVLKNLTLLGVGHVHVFDFDKIEEHNLTRCVLFRESDIGRFKADVAASSCRQIDPNIEILPSNLNFWDGLTLDEVSESDAVVCCVDNYEARIRLNQLCLMTGTDFYNTGIDSRFSSVEVYPFSTNPECACYECALPPSVYSTIQKRFSCGWLRKVAFEEKKIPTTAITSSLAGAVVVSMMLNRVNEHAQAIQTAVRHFQDSISLESTLSVMRRNEDCFACKSIDPCAVRLVAKRSCAHDSIIPLGDGSEVEVVLSEPVLIRGICKLCQREQEYFESTRRITDAATFCSVCGAYSVSTEFVERLPLAEFEKVFAGRNVPCKFLTYHADNRQVIVEMED
jgi:molybdopterin/thiamine biosynthesis adenylyltransferase